MATNARATRARRARAAQVPDAAPVAGPSVRVGVGGRARQQGPVERLDYRAPHDFSATLDFLRSRALAGIEQVDAGSYARVIGTADAPGWLRVSAWPGGAHALRLELYGTSPPDLPATVARVRRLFDLDADPAAIASVLRQDPRLAPLLRERPGLRVPGAWDGFELALRAVLGQQVSVAAARTLALRLAQRHGTPLAAPPAAGLTHHFPHPAALVDADLAAIGLTRARADTVRAVARAVLDGRIDFAPGRALEDFVARWTAVRGIGPWTAHYIALRALGHRDAFPAADLVLRRVAAGAAVPLTARTLSARAEGWRPWRAYAVIHLWRAASVAAA